MKRLIVGVIAAGCVLTGLPGSAAAQCEGGPTITGMYAPNGVYVPAHCAYTNPTTPGQLYPSGAQPGVTTNPVAGLSALPGQVVPTGSLPANTAVNPAPPYYSSNGILPTVPGVTIGTTAADQQNLAYNFSLPAAPPREGTAPLPVDAPNVVVSYPNE